ncbi:MAG: HEAT repeat domain-containing protein [Deltaproteobacteria bacterium]|nr:HEAT repeat domain-containing protein [Deltaproteobacteria bacterium]
MQPEDDPTQSSTPQYYQDETSINRRLGLVLSLASFTFGGCAAFQDNLLPEPPDNLYTHTGIIGQNNNLVGRDANYNFAQGINRVSIAATHSTTINDEQREAISKALNEITKNDSTSRDRAIKELVKFQDPSVGDLLVEIFYYDSDINIVSQALESLASIGDPRAVECIETALAIDNEDIVLAAVDATFQLDALPSRLLSAFEKRLQTPVVDESGGSDSGLEISCLLADSEEGKEILLRNITHPDYLVAACSVIGLAEANDPRAFPYLLELAESPIRQIQNNALWAIGAQINLLGDQVDVNDALELLEELAFTRDTANVAISTLGIIGKSGIPILLKLLDPEEFQNADIARKKNQIDETGVSYLSLVKNLYSAIRISCVEEGCSETDVDSLALERLRKVLPPESIELARKDVWNGINSYGELEALAWYGVDGVDLLRQVYDLSHGSNNSAILLAAKMPIDQIMQFCIPEIEHASVVQFLGRVLYEISDEDALVYAYKQILQSSLSNLDCNMHYNLMDLARKPECTTAISKALDLIEAESQMTGDLLSLKETIHRAANVGINLPFRLSPSTLNEIICNREAKYFDGRPIATIVTSPYDHNGAFLTTDNCLLRSLIMNGYCVMYYEVKSDSEMLESILASNTRSSESFTQPAKLIVLGAHGAQAGSMLGDKSSEDQRIDTEDDEQILLSGVGAALENGGQVILISCSTGRGREEADNVANLFRFAFPQASKVWAPEIPSNISAVKFSTSGEILEVNFGDKTPTYIAGIDNKRNGDYQSRFKGYSA